MYTVIHNYGNSYEMWNIFVAWPHLWLKLGTVRPEIMLCETVLNLSTLRIEDIDELRARILTAWEKWISALLIKQSDSGAHVFMHALKLKVNTLNTHSSVGLMCFC